MHSFFPVFIITIGVLVSNVTLQAQESPPNQIQEQPAHSIKPITPFTGKIVKDKVRMRLQPSLDAGIVRELGNGDLVIVTGASEDFYAIEPPTDLKAYIYRTFVLDGKVEGSRVNVRIAPLLDAPVIAQMNSGDPIVNGVIAGGDRKWIEFTPPTTTRFYVAKDYVTKIGDKSMLAAIKKRQEDVNATITLAAQTIQSEMQKPFDQIRIEEPMQKLHKAATEYRDFPEESSKAKALFASTQEAYLQKKIAFMEAQVKNMANQAAAPVAPKAPPVGIMEPTNPIPPSTNSQMAAWKAIEQQLYEDWAKQVPGEPTIEQFYQEQAQNMTAMQGIIEPYNRAVRNKPGDFILVTPNSHVPVAYLYSTQVNLQNHVGQLVTIKALPRSNNNFAFPAYFVVSVTP